MLFRRFVFGVLMRAAKNPAVQKKLVRWLAKPYGKHGHHYCAEQKGR